MAKNNWDSMGLFHPTYRRYNPSYNWLLGPPNKQSFCPRWHERPKRIHGWINSKNQVAQTRIRIPENTPMTIKFNSPAKIMRAHKTYIGDLLQKKPVVLLISNYEMALSGCWFGLGKDLINSYCWWKKSCTTQHAENHVNSEIFIYHINW